jgi:hypothetical protein
MAELFQRDKSTISRHIKNIFAEGELDGTVVVAEFTITTRHGAMEGKTQSNMTKFYNLDVIISVGYRVKSQRGVQFRIWATSVLNEYIKKVLHWMMIDLRNWADPREIPMTMEDWAKHLDGILTSSGEKLLIGNGRISHLQAMHKAQTEYKKYKAKTLSSVEKDYLESIKRLEDIGKQKSKSETK